MSINTKILTKRITEPFNKVDGYRIFVDRLYPRGISKERFIVDYWAKNIAPSTELRKWFHEDRETRWSEFVERYKEELKHNVDAAEFLSLITNHQTVTLLTEAKDIEHCHVPVIVSFIESQ